MSDVAELRKKVKELRAKQVPITKATFEDLQREVKADADLAKLEEKRARMAVMRAAKVAAKEKEKIEGPASPAPRAKPAKVASTKKPAVVSVKPVPSDTDEAPVFLTVDVPKKKKVVE